MNAFKTNRSLAILTGAVLLTPALLSAPAHAADKSKKYKTGALILGAAAAYLAVKGKTLPAAVVAAGGYYAYKKGQDTSNDDRYDNYYGNSNGRYDNSDYNGDLYNNRTRRQERRADRRNDNSYSRNGSYDSGYDNGNYDNSYDSGYDSSYDDSYNRNDNGYRGYKNYGQWKKAQRTIR